MSHLTEQQIVEYVAGETPWEWIDHIHSCPECAARARQLSEPLGFFADAVRGMVPFRPVFRLSKPQRLAYWPALVAVALLLLIAAPFYRGGHAPAAPRTPTVSDEVLLQRVQTAVAESVPGPMAPLALTLTSDSGNTE